MRVPIPSQRCDAVRVALALLFLFIVSSPASADQSPEWEEALNEDGIKVLTRDVPGQHVEPNGDLPGWMVNSLVTDTPHYSLKNLKDLVKDGKYSDAAFERDDEGKITGVAH